MNNYKVKLDLHVDTLVCELTRENITYASNITQADLKSGCVTLSQLKSIIQSNSNSILPGYNIEINEEYNSISSTHYLILKIEYSNEFIEFEEIFEFKQKGIKQVQDDEITELRKLVIDLQTKLNKQNKNNIIQEKIEYITIEKMQVPINIDTLVVYDNCFELYYYITIFPSNKKELFMLRIFGNNYLKYLEQLQKVNIKNLCCSCDKNLFEYNILINVSENIVISVNCKNLESISYLRITPSQEHFIEELMKYSNYKSVILPYIYTNKELEQHCENNNIIYSYGFYSQPAFNIYGSIRCD